MRPSELSPGGPVDEGVRRVLAEVERLCADTAGQRMPNSNVTAAVQVIAMTAGRVNAENARDYALGFMVILTSAIANAERAGDRVVASIDCTGGAGR